MGRWRGEAPRGDDPGEHDPAREGELPRPWDAGPPPPEPDLLESGADVPASRAPELPAWFRRIRSRLAVRDDPEPGLVASAEDGGAALGAPGAAGGGAAAPDAADDGGVAPGAARGGGAAPGADGPGRGVVPRRFGGRWVVVAALVGVVLGGVLVHGYDDRLAEQAERDTLALAARVVPIDTAGGQGRDSWLLRLVVANRGATTLKLRSATLAETPLRSSLRSVSKNVTLPAGKETWISMDVSGACAGGGLTHAPTALDAVVSAGERSARTVRIDLADDTSLLLSAARQTCMDSNFALWATAEQVGSAHIDKNGLFIPVRFRSNWSPAWEVSAVRNAGAGLAATVAATLPLRFTNGATPVTTVRWTITDCVQARALGYGDLRLRTTLTLPRGTRSIDVTTTLSGVLTEAVSLFVKRACV